MSEGAFVFPLSFAQRRLWFFEQLVPGSCVYNVPAVLALHADVDADVLAKAVSAVVERHEALRTTFGVVDGEPVQIVGPSAAIPMEIVDLRALGEDQAWREARAAAQAESRRPFDLEAGPLVRTTLLRLRGEAVLLLTMHHIVSDGWSMGVMVREIRTLYAAFAAGEPSPLPELAIQYPDFALWQRGWLTGEALDEQLRYWRERLRGALPLELPTDRPRPAVASFAGARAERALSSELHDRLRQLCTAEGLTPFMALLAGFAVVASRWAGQTDVVLGTPIANRTRAELEPLIGFFVNTLALRIDLSGEPSFRQLAARVREVALGAYAHQDLPFEAVVEDLAPARNLGRSPLFDVLFILHNTPGAARRSSSTSTSTSSPGRLAGDHRGTSKFDLTVSIAPTAQGLAVSAEYATDLFDPPTIERLLERFERTLDAVLADPDVAVGDLDVLAGDERELLDTWNHTAAAYPDRASLPELFSAQAARTPEATAVRDPAEHLSYRQLAERSDRLAAHLVGRGVRPGAIVGVCMQRSVRSVIALLAILKAGAAYLPLDPQDPDERNRAIAAAANAELVLTEPHFVAAFPAAFDVMGIDLGQRAHRLAGRIAAPATQGSRSLAYVMHTSGSTGRPRGVMVEHRSLVAYLTWVNTKLLPDPPPALAFTSRPTFDASLKQLWAPLIRGGEVWVPSELVARDPSLWPELLHQRAGRLAVNCVPTFWGAVLDALAERSQSLRCDLAGRLTHVLLSGEPPSSDLLKRTFESFPSAELWNLYGPTEATANGTAKRLTSAVQPLIGRPISNVRAYVLDARLRALPIGASGELCLAGPALARGYLNDADLTASRFVANPYGGPGDRLYRTGDRARWRADGELEYLGRLDDQVKIRGFRVEPAEVSAALLEHPAVGRCAVLARTDAFPGRVELALVAYLTPGAAPLPPAGELRRFAAARLPAHMVPAAFVALAELPLTPSGKLDRAALPAPGELPSGPEHPPRPPATATERAVVGVWQAVLGSDGIGVDEDFFALGGHSLLATQAVARIRRELGVNLPLRGLFEHPTAAALSAELDRLVAEDPTAASIPGGDIEPVPRSMFRRSLARNE